MLKGIGYMSQSRINYITVHNLQRCHLLVAFCLYVTMILLDCCSLALLQGHSLLACRGLVLLTTCCRLPLCYPGVSCLLQAGIVFRAGASWLLPSGLKLQLVCLLQVGILLQLQRCYLFVAVWHCVARVSVGYLFIWYCYRGAGFLLQSGI